MIRQKALTPADLRRPSLWGRPVRAYPTIKVRPVGGRAAASQKTGVSR